MAQRFRPPRDVPDFGLTPAEQARFKAWLRTAFVEIAEDLAALSRTDSAVGIAQETIDVAEGSLRRVTPPAGGMAVRVPPPTAANAGQSVRLMVEAPVGTLTVVSRPGIGDDGKVFQPTINGQQRATFTTSGLITLTSNGVNDWKTASEFAREAPASQATQTGQSVLDAEYLLGASNSRLSRARVADDSSEIDINRSSPGLISWFLKTASVGFSKLANLTGLSVFGRATNTDGPGAAIAATDGYQTLRSSPDGTSIGWESYLPATHTDTVSGTVEALPLPAGIKHGDFFNISATGNVTLDGIDATGVPTGFSFYLGFTITSGDIINTSFLLRDSQATASSNNLQLPGNEDVRMLSGSRVLVTRSTTTWRIEITPQTIIRNNGTLQAVRTVQNFINSTSNVAVVTGDAANNEYEIAYQRAALTGFVTATQNSNATSSAEPLVMYSSSGNASAERVTTSSTTITISTATAGQIEWRLGALTGAISTSANSLSTLFAGIRTNGTLQTARGFINFVDTTTVVWTAADDSANNEWEMRARHVFGNVRDNGSLETARGFINVLSTSTITALVTQDSTNDELELTWAVNQAADYAWTGDHDWSGGDYTFEGSIFGVHVNDVDIEANADITITSNLGDIILRGDATYLASNGLGGFLQIEAGTASPGLSLNEGMFWVEDPGTPATRPKFTDDANTDYTLAYAPDRIQTISGTSGGAGTIALDDDTLVVRWSASAGAINVDGFSGTLWEGRRVLLRNANTVGGNTVTLNPESAATSTHSIVGSGTGSATDASRTKVIRSRGQTWITYDSTSTRWYVDEI